MPKLNSKILRQNFSDRGTEARPAASAGEGVGRWEKIRPSDRGPAMTRANLSYGPLDKTLDSLALFRQKRLPCILKLATLPQYITRELLHQIPDMLGAINGVTDGKSMFR